MAAAAAPAPAAGKRKRDLSEDDAYLILHKYTPSKILTALQEVAHHAGRRRIDWRALVARTATGITSAREYQMLWRYFAYRHDFVEDVDHRAQPLGDESDLECEVEPFPSPSSKAVAQASEFAKILLCGSSREQAASDRLNSKVSMLNTPNKNIPRVAPDKQLGQSHLLTDGTGPVSNLKQASHTGFSPDPFNGNGPYKKAKKPKPWSKEEDADLTTGVHKCGEGNWQDILHKYSFDNTRSAVQLSQRWRQICRRQATTKQHANAKPVSANFDEIKAIQNAVSVAIDMPRGKPGLSAFRRAGPSQQSTQHRAPVFGTARPELKSAAHSSSLPLRVPVPASVPVPEQLQVHMLLPQIQQAHAQAAPLRSSNTSNKSRTNSKKQAAQTNPPSLIQTAAIAAGGRLAPESVATNLLKAAQSTKAVRVRSRGTGTSKTSTGYKSSTMASEFGTQLGSAQHPKLPNCSAPKSTKQVTAVPEVAAVNNTPEQSARAHFLETKRALSATPVSGPCDNMEIDDDSTFCVVTMEDLFPEDVKQSDIVEPMADEVIDTKDPAMVEFDHFVASQKEQAKQLSIVGKSTPVFATAAAPVKRTKTLGSTFPPAVTSSGLVGTGNAGVLSKALGGQPSGSGTMGKQNRCQEIMAKKQHATNSKSNIAAPSTGTPARSAAPAAREPTRNTAPNAGEPARNTAPGGRASGRNVPLSSGRIAKNTAPTTS